MGDFGLPIIDRTDPNKEKHGTFVVIGDQLQVDAHEFVWDPIGLAWVRATQAGGSGGGGTSSLFGAAFPASGTAAGAKDAGGLMAALNLDAAGFLKVNVAAGGAGGGVVQQGARDATAQSWFVSFNGVAQPISAAALPLPTGASTEATLANVLTTAAWQTRFPVQGQALMASSVPVVIASNQSGVPVTGTFFQATQPISAVSLPLPTGASTDRTTAAGPFSVRLSDGAAFYDATKTGQLPAALVGARLDVNVGAWLGSTVPTIGQKIMASSIPVVLASDQTVIPASQSGTWTVQQGTPPWTIDVTRVGGVILTGDNSANFAAKVPTLPLRANAASPAWTEGFQAPLSGDLSGRLRVVGYLDSDAVNDLQTLQVGGNARAVDDPAAVVSAVGDRVREWMDRFGSPVVRRRKVRETYTAVYRLAEAAARLDLSFTQVANTNKQWTTLHHTAAATKELTLLYCEIIITAFSVATQFVIELRELSVTTPPATGNPAITGRPHRVGTGAHEAVALALPTTQGSEAAVNSPLGSFAGDYAVWAAPAAQLQNGQFKYVLYDASAVDHEAIAPTVPVGVYGGWAVMIRTVGIPAIRATVRKIFREEIP